MGILSNELVVALIWVTATFASSVLVGPSPRRDLALRQSSVEIRQEKSICPDSYTSPNGLRFATHCNKRITLDADATSIVMDNVVHCMNHCSRYWGDGEGCYGLSWREADHKCYLQTSAILGITADNMTSDEGFHSAVVNPEDMKPLPSECPGENMSTHDFGNGLTYTLHCDKKIDGYDTCWEGYSDCKGKPYIGYHHTTSLQECLELCIKERPLCRAVMYNPTLEIGYANCWPKTGWTTDSLKTPKAATVHSAVISSIEQIDTKCPEGNVVKNDETTWDVQCGKFSSGTNLTSVHAQNITGCIDACANNGNGCVAVMFDSSLEFGYQNCYLQNTTSFISAKAEVTYAVQAGVSLPTSTPSPSSSSSSSPSVAPASGASPGAENSPPPAENNTNGGSPSKAWIAGPVAGGVVGLALIGVGLFWWRRRRSRAYGIGKRHELGPAPAYSPYVRPMELSADHTVEADASPAMKYANKKMFPPQELPS
ncbi:hypothetical protein BU24DRAFT_418879 [Aaosphaeria arxii CBS 175.79]|uniref:Apple domain-containing protein n=1 Tax=Aaosphaeria arxii CBS 175.79 TaxID=1450172 RepID=A0A6A5Y315_9PLEO|nr:uncharacterized protein BU24DRAFT_418879 [Aaosphaeria arxii CBS 175.79]KAF2019291.1 hypothetical protein BU24DRAFT_418879 [Aaosphaeria arxii CBS 175.79]